MNISKRFSSALFMVAASSSALIMAACGTNNSRSSIQGTVQGHGSDVAHTFSCTLSSTNDDNYKLTIYVDKGTMSVLQSSDSARYMPLKYSISENSSLSIPDQDAEFSCLNAQTTGDHYTLSIKIFADRMIILQNSDSTRYAPLKYDIRPH